MAKIVVLDAFTLSPLALGGNSPLHPSWDALAEQGQLILYPRTSISEVVERCADAEFILTNKATLNAGHFAELPNLKYVGVMATGVNIVELAAAKKHGVCVTNVPGYSTQSVAQHVFALLLELAARTGDTHLAVRKGDWVKCPDFSFSVAPFFEMSGKTLGIVGFGAIGQAVARIGVALGMRILVHSRTRKDLDIPLEWADLDTVLSESDALTLHCPLTPDTQHFINAESLAMMKPTAYLINTGRGPLIDETALSQALAANQIAGFGADVLSSEPPSADNPLLSAPNTVLTPHIAWASVEARQRLMSRIVENVRAFRSGAPIHVVT